MTAVRVALAALFLAGCRQPSEGVPTADLVRRMARSGEALSYAELDRYGAAAFPAYETILSDPGSDPREVAGVLAALARGDGPRGQFLRHAVPRLAHPDRDVRDAALGLVGRIGTETEGPALVPLLSDEDEFIPRRAARALARVGGSGELAAVDAWLRTANARGGNRTTLDYVRECRDELDARLRGVALAPPPRPRKD